LERRIIELPAGLAGDSLEQFGEPLVEAALRELLEETGYSAGEMVLLTSGPPSAGLATEIVSFFLARQLRRTSAGGGDHQEDIVVHEVPLSEIDAWLKNKAAEGLLVDPKVYAGLYFAQQQ
jgi:ADP-ribose pyrophosphatase